MRQVNREQRVLLYLFGLCLPFTVTGAHVAGQIWLAPSIGIGALLAGVMLVRRGINVRFVLLLLMLSIFTLTAAGRHHPSTYASSLLALFVVMLPLVIPMLSDRERVTLLNGFSAGFIIVLIIFWAEIVLQVLDMREGYVTLTSLFRGVEQIERGHNYYIAYYRPYGPMPEPAALGYYLAFSYAIFDKASFTNSGNTKWVVLKVLAVIAIVAGGSLVGLFLVLSYVLTSLVLRGVRGAIKVWRRRTLEKSRIVSTIVLVLGLFSVLSVFHSEAGEGFKKIGDRVVKIHSVLVSGDLSGSEGSRMNSYILVQEYFSSSGALAVLVGTGYANYSDWLKERFGGRAGNVSAARGTADNRLVIVLLSTGIAGTIVYILFFGSVFWRFYAEKEISLIVLFVIAHFATGALLAYAHWQLLLILLMVSAARKMRLRTKA